MDRSRLLIVMCDKAWTLAALHLACAMSRRGEASVLLLKMVPVRHPSLLGTAEGALDFTSADAAVLTEMAATAEDYGVPLDIEVCQYANYWHAMVDAADQLGVTAVIANIPHSSIPYWYNFRRWLLRRQLARHGQLFTPLDDLDLSLTWTPSITLEEETARALDRHHTP